MEKNKKSKKTLVIISLILILVGVGIFSYPYISNYLAEKNQTQVIRAYEEKVKNLDDQSKEEEFLRAQKYNAKISGDPEHEILISNSKTELPEKYKEILNVTNDGIMGYIEIPKISVYLPIYHGTSEEVLKKGVGHLETTSFPIGGESTHAVLTGHTGLPSAELFTRLDELETGDTFNVHVLDKILTYRIYETKVVLPHEVSELQIEQDKDIVTLVTCTPYGVNSHRLLVKANRVEQGEPNEEIFNEEINTTVETNSLKEENTSKEKNYYLRGMLIGGAILVLLIAVLIIIKKIGEKKHE